VAYPLSRSALGGGVPSGLWMVPPRCAVWVPGGMEHSNLATANARIFFAYIEPGAVDLLDRCCTLSISPLLRELIVELSDRVEDDDARGGVALSESSLARLVVRETGLTFGRWRQQLHLIVAIRELASGASVQQVSADLGYESVTAFITVFKKALGKPPAKYLSRVAQNGGSAFVA